LKKGKYSLTNTQTQGSKKLSSKYMEKAKNQHKILRKEIAHRGLRSELLTITDNTGKIIHRTVRPLMVKFKLKDLFQIIVGSLLFGVPISFSEEVWQIAEHLPIQNTIVIGALSIFCISILRQTLGEETLGRICKAEHCHVLCIIASDNTVPYAHPSRSMGRIIYIWDKTRHTDHPSCLNECNGCGHSEVKSRSS
jgi:hypothetical protein